VTVNVTIWDASSAGPAEMLLAQPGTVTGPASSSTVSCDALSKLGASFTGMIEITMVAVSHSPVGSQTS
jgi:hypothetical protein